MLAVRKRIQCISCVGMLIVGALVAVSAQANSLPVRASTKSVTDRGAIGQPNPSQLPRIRTAKMNINYRIFTANGEPPIRVELWYAHGWDTGWQLYDYDEDCRSPVPFIAPGEGIYRFIVVAVDRWGRKSYDVSNSSGPLRGKAAADITAFQQVVFVDYIAPNLFLSYPRLGMPDYRAENLSIRWVGFDTHLDARPVLIYYKRQGSEPWRQISGPQPSQGEFVWQLPERLTGPVLIMVGITDQAGNQAEQISGVIHIHGDVSLRTQMVSPASTDFSPNIAMEKRVDPNSATISLSPARAFTLLDNRDKVGFYFRRGNLYSQRLEWDQAARAFHKVLEYDPQCVSARVNLANALFRQDLYVEAQAEYERCLLQNRRQESALFGLSQTQIKLKQFDKAQQTLANLLEQDRRDWQAWLMHGDVSEKLGQRNAAVESWQQASHDMSPVRRLAIDQLIRVNQSP
jgi:tetratricopeptide (TPR) repeat protein